MPPNLLALRQYAMKADPSSLPASVLLQHTPTTLTIFDAYPKSMFHFLILPRVLTSEPALTAKDISSLRTLCKRGKDQAKAVVFGLAEEAQRVRATIEEEMVNRYGFKWEIWTGFHTVPSMEHLHLHVLSADLVSSAMKNKRHYNSFHPTRGFFLHLDEVLSWFDSDDSSFATMSALDPTRYESLLKEDLSCFRCEQEFKQMPKLKEHLKEEWEKRRKRVQAREARESKTKISNKRPAEQREGEAIENPEDTKRQKSVCETPKGGLT